jgi:hypothetical protein
MESLQTQGKREGGSGMSVQVFQGIIGKTIEAVEGLDVDSELATFCFTDGTVFTMQHEPDCCETVRIASIDGDAAWLIGKPLVMAECVGNSDEPPPAEGCDTSWAWSFLKFATNAGSVTVRWFGTSNGYYSEVPAVRYGETRYFL